MTTYLDVLSLAVRNHVPVLVFTPPASIGTQARNSDLPTHVIVSKTAEPEALFS